MSGPAIQALGWSLVHFLWQGALVALALEAALFVMRERSARARYALRCAALGVMGLLPVATFLWLRRGAAVPPVLPEQLEAYLAAARSADAALAGPGLMGWCVALWALGASLCAARVLRDYARIRRLQSSHAGRPLPADWQARFERLSSRMGVRAVVRVIDTAALAAPTVIGWLKPVILVPARALTGLTTEQLEVVLIHELAHVRRHDYLVNLVQSALEALLFYQPAVWWVSHGIRAEREFCCDDAALSLSSDGIVYARALATLEGWRNVHPELALSTLGGPLMTRIQRLIGIRPSSRPVRGPLAALGVLLVIGSATAFANQPADGQDPAQLKLMRERLEEMQQRLDELRAMLDQSAADPAAPSGLRQRIEERHPEGNVWFFDESGEGTKVEHEFRGWTSEAPDEEHGHQGRWSLQIGPGEHETLTLRDKHGDDDAEGNRVVVRIRGDESDREELQAKIKGLVELRLQDDEGDGDWRRKVTELRGQLGKLHEEHDGEQGHMRALHDHLRTLLHGKDADHDDEGVEGEAEIEVIIRRDNEPEQRIRRRIPLDGARNLELFFDHEEDEGEGAWLLKGQRLGYRILGADEGDEGLGKHSLFYAGDDDRKVHVLKLKELLEDQRERVDENRHRVIELKSLDEASEEEAAPTDITVRKSEII